MSAVSRSVIKSVYAKEMSEGAGAKVRRSIGTAQLRNLSPFLILDHFTIKKGGGFPDHPHRGQSTTTYILGGKIQHEDMLGNRGILGPGDVQWMTAGKGIVHAEMPYFDDVDPQDTTGLQLWTDLPEDKKFSDPSYQERRAADIDTARPSDGVAITVISGESHGVKGFVRPLGGCWFMDFHLSKAGATVFQPIPKGWTTFLYGQVQVGDEIYPHDAFNTLVLSAGDADGVKLTRPAGSKEDTQFILVAGEPLNQRVVQYGPFVVNSAQQVQQAFEDYQLGQNGFEKAPGWHSEIGHRSRH